MPEDATSISGSELSDASHTTEVATVSPSRHRKRRLPRKTTTCILAYPALRFAGKRRMVQKVIPKLYLQLQEVSPDRRPKPVIDVFPSSRIAGPVIAPRLASRFPRLFGVKGALGSGDVVVMQSEDYEAVSDGLESDDEERDLDPRKLIAVLSPVRKSDYTEIVLHDGSVWVAQPLPTGSFDFVHVDAHGNTTTARWARRSPSKRNSLLDRDVASKESQTPQGEHSADLQALKYTFSVINPLSRRHPIMATLTPSSLDTQDHYTTVSTSSGRYPPSRFLSRNPSLTASPRPSHPASSTPVSSSTHSVASAPDGEGDSGTAFPPEPESERSTHPVDEATKTLISVTAVWLALQLGWSPYYKPHLTHAIDYSSPLNHSRDSAPISTATGTPVASAHQSRRSTWNHRSNSGGSNQLTSQPSQPAHSVTAADGSTPSKNGSSFTARKGTSPPLLTRPAPGGTRSRDQFPERSTTGIAPPSTPGQVYSMPQRATSTGATFMQRHIACQKQHSHAPEACDSERGTSGRCRRILSGEWTPIRTGLPALATDTIALHRPSSPPARFPSEEVIREPTPLSGRGRGNGSESSLATSPTDTTVLDRPKQCGNLTAGAAIPAQLMAGGKKAQSTYYPNGTDAMEHSEVSGDVDLVNPGSGHGYGAPVDYPVGVHLGRNPEVPHDARRGGHGGGGVGGKLRNLGNWFRKLGAH